VFELVFNLGESWGMYYFTNTIPIRHYLVWEQSSTKSPQQLAIEARQLFILLTDSFNHLSVIFDSQRTKTLNEQKYGSQSDWTIPVARKVAKNCGQIEKAMHAKLKKFYVFGKYMKDGTTQSTYELFSYPIEAAAQYLDGLVINLQDNDNI
jgi:hypothetical protein